MENQNNIKTDKKDSKEIADEEKEAQETKLFLNINEADLSEVKNMIYDPKSDVNLQSPKSWEELNVDEKLIEKLLLRGFKKPSII